MGYTLQMPCPGKLKEKDECNKDALSWLCIDCDQQLKIYTAQTDRFIFCE
jgi:hypothetical protein